MSTPAFELTQADLEWLAEAGIRERQNRRYAQVRAELAAIEAGEREPVVTVTPQPVVGYLLGVLIIAAGLFTSLVTPHLSGGTILAALLIATGGGICVRVAIVAGRGATS